MKHLGDITKINGAEIPPVDVITFGAPCQDLSVAGLRKGMLHADLGDEETSRSGLFMDAVRIIKEMRANEIRSGRTGIHVRPRYAIYENVPGAFSSNGGKDWQTVLTELVRVVCPDAPDVPLPDKGGWPKAGCLYDELGRWSLAYRLHDAQYWGVPQRRKRVCICVDFNGLTAAEILFDPQLRGEAEDSEPDESLRDSGAGHRSEVPPLGPRLSGNSEPSGAEGQGTPKSPSGRSDGTGAISFQERAGKPGGARGSSCRMNTQEPCQPSTTNPSSPDGPEAYGISPFESNAMLSPNPKSGIYKADTSRTLDLNGGNPACNQGGGIGDNALCGGGRLPECDGKPFCERHSASQGTGEQFEPEQRSQSAEPVNGGGGAGFVPDTAHALRAKANCAFREDGETFLATAKCFQNTGIGWWNESDTAQTLRTPCGGDGTKANIVLPPRNP